MASAPYVIIPRREWGANAESLPKAAMQLPARRVFIHHTVTPVTANLSADVRAVEAVGLDRFGQFPYSYVIHPHGGEIFEGCGLRRGAHTKDRNTTAFGIAWIGNYDERQPTVQQLDATRQLIADLTGQGHLVPGADIRGHRDVYSTACPGQKLYDLLPVIRYPWEENMPDDPNLPNLPDVKFFEAIVGEDRREDSPTRGQIICLGYYIVSSDAQLHAFGPGAPYYGRSEVVTD